MTSDQMLFNHLIVIDWSCSWWSRSWTRSEQLKKTFIFGRNIHKYLSVIGTNLEKYIISAEAGSFRYISNYNSKFEVNPSHYTSLLVTNV